MSQARPDEHRTRFRRPLGVAVMAYKALLGLSEIVVGILLAVPSFDPQATFARLSAEELREDPGDRFVALVGRHLPAVLHHRGLVAVGLIVLGLAKLVAAAAMWEGQEWGGYLLAATVALLLPFDLRQAVVDPTVGHVLLAVANTAALAVLVLLLRNWLPASPDGNGGVGGEAASRFSEIARMRARPVGPAQARRAVVFNHPPRNALSRALYVVFNLVMRLTGEQLSGHCRPVGRDAEGARAHRLRRSYERRSRTSQVAGLQRAS
jgi:uncharacterized membrane protein